AEECSGERTYQVPRGWAILFSDWDTIRKELLRKRLRSFNKLCHGRKGERDRVAALAHAFAASGKKSEALKELGILQRMAASPEHSYLMALFTPPFQIKIGLLSGWIKPMTSGITRSR